MSAKSTDLTTSSDDQHFVDPGLPAHTPRRVDTDPQRARRAERQVIVLFVVSILGTLGALVAYFVLPPGSTTSSVRISTLTLGVAISCALLGIGTGAIHWARTLMSDREIVEERHPLRSDDAERAGAVEVLAQGVQDSGIARRGVLKGTMLSALALFPLSIAVPLVAGVGGDWNVAKIRHTIWRQGTRLTTDPTGRPIKAGDLDVGSVVHVIPEATEAERSTHEWMAEKSKAVVLLVRLDPSDLTETAERSTWSHEGIVAYSKICTHVGCPVALYEQQTHHLLCPCHQSTFDIADGAKVVFGPAKRPLPQLPITVDDEGYLIAQSDFHEPIGPSFWERLK